MNNPDIPHLTEQVKTLAEEVGRYILDQRRSFSEDSVERKSAHDYVSYVDKQAEKMIVERLRELLPEAGFVTEEQTVSQSAGQEYCWVVDPLDGPTNFIKDVPL